MLTNDQNEILSNVSVTLWENHDSITSVHSDIKGQFLISTAFNYDKVYMLTFDYKYQSQSDIILFQPSDSIIMPEYIIEVQLIKNIYENVEQNSAVYFEKNKTTGFDGFDPEYLTLLIEQNPGICLNMIYMGSPQEKKDFGSIRIKNLRKYLVKNNIRMKNIVFTDDKILVRAYEDDQRAVILISVNSLEGCE
jgi:hypothetical protein